MIEALKENTSINLSKYLHEILPGLISCICTSKLSNSGENHFELRYHAVIQLSELIHAYTTNVNNLELRLITLFRKTLLNERENSPQKEINISTKFGCLTFLCQMGEKSIFEVLLPILKDQYAPIENILSSKDPDRSQEISAKQIKYLLVGDDNKINNQKNIRSDEPDYGDKFITCLKGNLSLLEIKVGNELHQFIEYFGRNLGKNIFERIKNESFADEMS